MAGPWEKYAQPDQTAQGPWSKYTAPVTTPQAQPKPTFMQKATLASNKFNQMKHAGKLGVTQGASLGFLDEIVGAGAAVIPGGKGYTEARDDARSHINEIKERNPKSFLAGELGGGVATGGAGGARTAGLKGSAALGAAYGAGTADSGFKDRLQGAAIGGGLGAGMHFGADKVGKAIAPLLKSKPKTSKAMPSLDDLRATKNRLYQQADQQGATYSPQQLKTLFRAVDDEIPTQGLGRITGRTHPTTNAMLKQIGGQTDNPATLTDLDRLRQLSGSAAVTNPADQRLSGIIRQNIDEFAEATTPASGGNAAPILKQARAANSQFRKAELLEEQLYKGINRAARNGSGGNEQNAIRQNISRILDNKKLRRGFSDDEIAQMETVVRGGSAQNLTRLVGKLSPEGNGLMAMLGIGGTAINPAMGLASGAGFVSKRASDKMAKNSIDDLVRLVRTGQSVAPQPTAASQAARNPELQALLAQMGVIAAH